ncbi:hypothetical protein [Microlunatus parietis]|uniref:Uncharacterized protein n=1 Tax=Microlunatus parietis TaxID=682979 RepID=A0A7Y9I6Y2_9ACTN|nr:hypothetical protein [Microlunatus parietis]NYE71375.1 hypothetical protein [Microlunatus parietis]
MNAADAGAAPRPRRTALDLLMNPRYGVHRFIALCLAVALIAGTVWIVIVARQAALEGLPGVARVDSTAHEIELGSEATAEQALEVLHVARDRDEGWTLVLGSARLASRTSVGDQATDDTAAVNLLRRLGVVRLTAPATIVVDPYGSSAEIILDSSARPVPFAAGLIRELSAGRPLGADRVIISGGATNTTVTLQRAAFTRSPEIADVLTSLERVSPIRRLVLGDLVQVQLSADGPSDATRTCALARERLGERKNHELTVRYYDAGDGRDENDAVTRPC